MGLSSGNKDFNMPFALREKLASDRAGHDVWYEFWTAIGPCCTRDSKKRALLKTREEWLPSKALSHSLSSFEIVELPHDAEGQYDWDKPAGL